jgi:hypothetical protein
MNRYLPWLGMLILGMMLGCGTPENFREAFQYYDDSTVTVKTLENYESQLRVLANQAADGNINDQWKGKLEGISNELVSILTVEQNNMGVKRLKLKMKYEMIDWLNALLAACGEGLKPVVSPEKTACSMYHYLDLAGEMGRIVRSDRELLNGQYRSLH